MKLRNKKTGEIVDLSEGFIKDVYCGERIQTKPVAISNKEGYLYNSLAELNAEWEDYEEPKEYWYLENDGDIDNFRWDGDDYDKRMMRIGNCFETKEEAEKAMEKLKAWKRLKDKGLRFCGHDDRDRGQLGDIVIYAEMPTFEYDDDSTRDDLDLLFGGEEREKK